MRTIIPPNAFLVPEQAKKVFQGDIFSVYHWQQAMYDGSTQTFEMLKRPDSVQVLAVKDDKLVVLLEEQPDFPEPLYGIPGGRHDVDSETELEAAQRELLEETGMKFSTWRLVKLYQPYNKIEQFVYYFLATGFESQESPSTDRGEKVEVLLMDLDEAIRIAATPKSRHIPADLLMQAGSAAELANLPQYGA